MLKLQCTVVTDGIKLFWFVIFDRKLSSRSIRPLNVDADVDLDVDLDVDVDLDDGWTKLEILLYSSG